jgi:hypothetical protein
MTTVYFIAHLSHLVSLDPILDLNRLPKQCLQDHVFGILRREFQQLGP